MMQPPNADRKADQMLFDFGPAEPKAQPAPVAAKPTPLVPKRSETKPPLPTPQEMAEFRQLASEAPAPGADAFITESQVSDLYLQIAREYRGPQVKRMRILFKPFRATLYSYKIQKNGVAVVKFHMAFRRASAAVFEQAGRIMFSRKRSDRKTMRRTEYDAFVRAIPPTDFELPGARPSRRVAVVEPGVHRSLDESFDRVNREYFKGQMAKPELCWSPVRARRILGSYQERNDRLIISRVFDSLKVPVFVLDFLMFHELLHKFLGIGKMDDGRRCMHGADFRAIERTFKNYSEAKKYLKGM